MNDFAFIHNLNISSEAESRISLFLNSIVKGSDTVLRSAIGNTKDSEQILSDWDDIFNSNISKMSETLLEFERLNRSNYSPRSLAIPWVDRKPGILDYYSSNNSYILPDVENVSLSRRLRPLSVDNSLLYLKRNTNSGLPFVTRKSKIIDLLAKDFNGLLDRKDPCILFTRTQESMKTRNVWGYPVIDTLNEMRFYRPLLVYQREQAWRTALLSPEATDLSLDRLIKNSIRSKSRLLSIDFSSYDASVKTGLQDCAFKYISNLYQSAFLDDLKYISNRFNTIELITPDGILSGPHGVPSGSTFTNEVDSIVQYLCARDFGIEPFDMNIQGDDGVYVTKFPDELTNHFKKFGLNPNESKSYIFDNEAIYLQNLYSTDYQFNGIIRGIYPTYRALSRIIFPERYDQYSVDGIEGASYNSIRAISILENCSYHPLFEELVKFVYKLDKYKLCFNQQQLDMYIKRRSSSEGVEGIFNYRKGDNLKGIYNFNTIKVLSKL